MGITCSSLAGTFEIFLTEANIGLYPAGICLAPGQKVPYEIVWSHEAHYRENPPRLTMLRISKSQACHSDHLLSQGQVRSMFHWKNPNHASSNETESLSVTYRHMQGIINEAKTWHASIKRSHDEIRAAAKEAQKGGMTADSLLYSAALLSYISSHQVTAELFGKCAQLAAFKSCDAYALLMEVAAAYDETRYADDATAAWAESIRNSCDTYWHSMRVLAGVRRCFINKDYERMHIFFRKAREHSENHDMPKLASEHALRMAWSYLISGSKLEDAIQLMQYAYDMWEENHSRIELLNELAVFINNAT